jgi:hypothetical protein
MIYLKQCDPTNGCGKTYPGDLDQCPKCGTPESFSYPAAINPRDYCYDEETYPNIFTCCFIHIATDTRWRFEISDRINQMREFVEFVYALRDCNARMVGYNNVGFDYPVMHYIMMNQWVGAPEIYTKAMSIIRGQDKFGHMIWDNDRIVEQLDLYKICHFDNAARATSLKSLEFAMRMDSVEDLPFEVGLTLDDEQKEVLHTYNAHDVVSTCMFYARCLDQIAFRETLTKKHNRNFMNHNDAKIGAEIFIMKLEESGIECYEKVKGRRQPRQTFRPSIDLNQVVAPWIEFEQPEFQRILNWFKAQTITETKGVFKDVNCSVDGLQFDFGTGGIHACVNGRIFEAKENQVIQLRDVVSYYPNLAIKNRYHPEHMGDGFCNIYEDLFNQRRSYPKGTPENAALKLSLNGTYGNSNNVYSPFYDPFFTMQITINGQLQLCLLAEKLMKAPSLEMIQLNTDGVAFICDKVDLPYVDAVCAWWEQVTCLELETDDVSRFFSRDVNNYIMEHTNGKIKRKGAYVSAVNWHQDPSALVVPKAAEAALVHGVDIRTFIENHDDDFDFMIRAKVPRSNNLVMRYAEWDVEIKLPNIARYYISNTGGSLVKIAPPTGVAGTWKRKPRVPDAEYERVIAELGEVDYVSDWGQERYGIPCDVIGTPHDERIHTKNKSKHTIREMGVSVGWKCTECNHIKNFDRSTVNYDYYVAEAEKLVKPLLTAVS